MINENTWTQKPWGWKSRNQRVSSIACAERILLDDAKSYLPATDVSVKICHCHGAQQSGKWWKKMENTVWVWSADRTRRLPDDLVACSWWWLLTWPWTSENLRKAESIPSLDFSLPYFCACMYCRHHPAKVMVHRGYGNWVNAKDVAWVSRICHKQLRTWKRSCHSGPLDLNHLNPKFLPPTESLVPPSANPSTDRL